MANFFAFLSEQWILTVSFLTFTFLFFFTERKKSGKSINNSMLVSMMNKKEAILIDVRETASYSAGHIFGAINIPHNKMSTRVSELEKYRSKIIVLVDQMGQHAGALGKLLTKDGYKVRRLSGGMTEWTSNSMPTVTGKKD